jgi:mannose-1-phosphate guanylyltransferase
MSFKQPNPVPRLPDFTQPAGGPTIGRGGTPVQAIILVGGRGTRLDPLTDHTPKPLLEVGGVPMFEHTVARLARAGVTEVTLALAFRPSDFLTAYPENELHGVKLRYSLEETPLDTGGAIAHAMRSSNITDTFVVCNGDIIDGVEIAPLLDAHLAGDQLATIELTEVDDPSSYGVVPTDADGRVERFVEKPARHEAPCCNINTGTYILEPAALNGIGAGQRVSIERETFPALAEAGALYAFSYQDYWIDAGKLDTYRQANFDMAAVTAPLHPRAKIDPASQVEHSVVGAGCVIEPGAVVRGSVLGAGTRVGFGATVIDSIVGPGGAIPPGASVVEAVIPGR